MTNLVRIAQRGWSVQIGSLSHITRGKSNLAKAALNALPLPLAVGDRDFRLTQGSFDPQKSSPQTGPQSAQPFLHTKKSKAA